MKSTKHSGHNGMPSPEMTRRIATVFKAMAEPIRLRILYELQQSDVCVGDLVERLGCSQANVSKHLAILRNAGLIDSSSSGTTHYYSVSDPIVVSVCASVCDSVERRSRELHGQS
ncbi:winged helix-turn-helix transcriptional regulator [candidate division KSB1 bacterium]|nr:winged helix-turn-helix transcriptional regulator [candidate division KSB1 bacterium]